MITDLLKNLDINNIDKETMLKIYEESRDPLKALELYKKAFQVREEIKGNKIEAITGSGVILDCKLTPPCSYCGVWDNKSERFEKVLQAIPTLSKIGIDKIMLVGGSSIDGHDDEAIRLVKAINDVSDIKIEINFGGLFSKDTVKKLKGMNVVGITSSLEVYNEEIFRAAKPGDSFEMRKELLQTAEDEGLPIRSFMMAGLGESDKDRIDHLFYLKSFKQMSNLMLSKFTPYEGTPYGDRMPCPTWEIARTIAIARLIMPNINILSGRTGTEAIPLWYIAGGGNQIFGVGISEIKDIKLESGEEIIPVNSEMAIVNRIPVIKHQLEGMGAKVEMPELKRI